MKNQHKFSRNWILLGIITLIYYFANMQKVIIPGAAFDELQHAFSLDAAGVTRLGAVFLGVYAFAQLVIGLLADRFGGARVIVAGGLVFCLGSIMSALDNSLILLYFSRFLTGFGAASIYLSMVKEIDRIAGSAMPMVLGIATIIGYSGSITGAAPFFAGVKKFGYSPMFLGAGIAALICYLAYVLLIYKEEFPPVRKEVKFSISAYISVFASKQNFCLILSIGISFGTYFALQSTVGKKFLEDFCDLSGNASGIVMTATMLIAAVNGFVVANICRLIKNRRMPVIAFSAWGCCIGALMILAGVLGRTHWVLPVSGMLVMAFAGNISPIYVALLKESNDVNRFGTVICVGNALAYGISAFVSGSAGKLMDFYSPEVIDGIKTYGRESYILVFGVLAFLGLLAGILSLAVKESFGKDISGQFRN